MCFGGRAVKIGDSKVDFKGLVIDGPNGRQSMEPKIIKLLRVMADNAGEVMTREDLITAVWGVEYGGDERLSRAISILRKALGDKRGQHTHISTISRVGYRLIAKVSEEDNAAPDQIANQISSQTTPNLPKLELNVPAVMAKKIEANLSKKAPDISGFSVKRLASILTVAVAVLIIGFWSLSTFWPKETLSVQARLDLGYSNVENFTAETAMVEAQEAFKSILSDNPDHAAARAGLAFSLFQEYSFLEGDPEILKRAKSHAEAAFRQDEHLALSNIATAWAAEYDGDFDRAHTFLDRADILSPDHYLSIEGRYRTFGKSGELQKALEVLEAAVTKYPDHPVFYTYLGSLQARTGNSQDAERNFKRAIELDPDNARTYAQLAHSLHLQGRTDEAISEIQKGLQVNETALLYNNLGTYLFFQGHYHLAVSAFEQTIAVDGDTHDLLYWANLGDAYRWSENKTKEAATAYRRALQLLQAELDNFPDSPNLKSRAAMFNAKLGNLDGARAYINTLSLTPSSEPVQLYRAVITYEILAERERALEFLEAALNADYPLIEIYNDPELSQLRQDPSYHRLLAKTQSD